MEPSSADWDRLEKLADRVGVPPERVSALRQRMDGDRRRPGSPYTLLAGRTDGGIEILLARWVSPDAAEALKRAGELPLVIGAEPEKVRPVRGTWPTFGWPSCPCGHVLALRSDRMPGPEVLAQLATLGYADQLLLVTRLGQPMHQTERELARCLASVAATVRVLIVGLAGEEPSESELAEVSAFAGSIMRQAGIHGVRFAGASVWFAGGRQGYPDAAAALKSSLAVNPSAVSAGQPLMFRQCLTALVQDLSRRAQEQTGRDGRTAAARVTPEDCERLTRELSGFLDALGRELSGFVQSPRPMSTQVVQTYALDAVRGWGAYVTIEGHWLRYVECLRPGTQAALLEEMKTALACLEYQPAQATKRLLPPAGPPSPPLVERIIVEAKRLACGLVVGLAAYWLAASGLSGPAQATNEVQPAHHLPPVAVTALALVSLILGWVLGYALARRFFRLPQSVPQESVPPSGPSLWGWEQVQRRVTAWVAARLGNRSPTPQEEIRELSTRLALEEVSP